MQTAEMRSDSKQSQIVYDEGKKETVLYYNYVSEPIASVRHRSKIHKGFALLYYREKPRETLKGDYWTDRKTIGEIQLEFRTRKIDI